MPDAPNAAAGGDWLYWSCPECHTSLVGKRSELGQRHRCAGCGRETTVGGVAPAAAGQPHPKATGAQSPVRRATGPQAPAAAHTQIAPVAPPGHPLPPAQPLSASPSLDAAARERRAAADAAADALRPHLPSPTPPAAQPGGVPARRSTGAAGAGRSAGEARGPRNDRAERRRPTPGRGVKIALVVVLAVLIVAAVLLPARWAEMEKRNAELQAQLQAAPAAPLSPPGASAATIPPPLTNPPPEPARPAAPVVTPASAPATPAVTTPPGTTPAAADLKPEEVYAQAEAAVVVINCFTLQPQQQIAIGSGFILAKENVIITNAHVVDGADLLEIKTKDGVTARVAHTLAVDANRDVAILALPRTLQDRAGLKLSTTLPKIGETVFALGAPHGLDYTFTRGLVSQIRTQVPHYNTLIQTDASISPGSSGGPLLNSRCEVVGITTLASHAAKDANNLNFAVAAAEVQKVFNAKGQPKPLVDR